MEPRFVDYDWSINYIPRNGMGPPCHCIKSNDVNIGPMFVFATESGSL